MRLRRISSEEPERTQLTAIRELMLAAAPFDDWLTLAEIAEATEFGEASISAQLRNLRKPEHGRYQVAKRRRRAGLKDNRSGARPSDTPWEYRIGGNGLQADADHPSCDDKNPGNDPGEGPCRDEENPCNGSLRGGDVLPILTELRDAELKEIPVQCDSCEEVRDR